MTVGSENDIVIKLETGDNMTIYEYYYNYHIYQQHQPQYNIRQTVLVVLR